MIYVHITIVIIHGIYRNDQLPGFNNNHQTFKLYYL